MESGLNLARKWRSKDFLQIVGQELSVRLLKNSLFKNQFFPVYLFSGQRGCGKTTTARVFAAALNCENLVDFQKDPQSNKLPCLVCYSCKCMKSGNHPDFIEIDAASNTGVDNVRNIIDSASFLPILGKKKIYLIDEAHMLSKAAFNALLKILEEPPLNVVFILATTDPQKIIDTVKSRCFQLFFTPVSFELITNHLIEICTQENIKFESRALLFIAHESEGSLRDAINLLERVRLSCDTINEKSVCDILGHLDDSKILELFELVLNQNLPELIKFIDSLDLERYSLVPLWKKFVELIKNSIWLKSGINLDSYYLDKQIKVNLEKIISEINIQKLIYLLEISYEFEQTFSKTALPQIMLQMMLLKMATISNNINGDQIITQAVTRSNSIATSSSNLNPDKQIKTPESTVRIQEQKTEKILNPWEKIINNLSSLGDPLIASIFKQGTLINYKIDKEVINIEVNFPAELSFFKEQLESSKNIWNQFLNRILNAEINFLPIFEKPSSEKKNLVNNVANNLEAAQIVTNQATLESSKSVYLKKTVTNNSVNNLIDVIDKEKWQKTHTLLSVFPGKITQIN